VCVRLLLPRYAFLPTAEASAELNKELNKESNARKTPLKWARNRGEKGAARRGEAGVGAGYRAADVSLTLGVHSLGSGWAC
jgi:hypothetical protein